MAETMRIAELWRYPVKSMAGERLESVGLGPRGLEGDRGWALRDEKADRTASAKRLPGLMRFTARGAGTRVAIELPDGERLRAVDADAGERIGAALGAPVSLWPVEKPLPERWPSRALKSRPPLEAYFDAYPVHLVTAETLADHRFDARRFRPNIVLSGAGPGRPELGWTGRTLRCGGARLKIVQATGRCVMTTLPVDELPRDPAVLETLTRETHGRLGVYAEVEAGGRLETGAEAVLE